MYGGRLVEYGTVNDIFRKHRHPYTEGLIKATPSIIGDIDKLSPIEGAPPDLMNLPKGCIFSPRCPYAQDICAVVTSRRPYIRTTASKGRCYFYEERKMADKLNKTQTEENLSSAERQPLMRLENINMVFKKSNGLLTDKHIHVLKNISLDIEQGEIIALVGESGCGKPLSAG